MTTPQPVSPHAEISAAPLLALLTEWTEQRKQATALVPMSTPEADYTPAMYEAAGAEMAFRVCLGGLREALGLPRTDVEDDEL